VTPASIAGLQIPENSHSAEASRTLETDAQLERPTLEVIAYIHLDFVGACAGANAQAHTCRQ
jgi:hypothetical protein